MGCQIRINYAYSKDEISITLSQEFKELPAIHRADALQDALHDLTILYNETVDQIGKEAV